MQTIKYQGTLDARCLVARSVWWNGLIPPTGMQSAFVIGLDPGAQVSYFAVKVDIGFGDAMVRAPPTCSVLSFGCVSVDFSKDNPVHDALTNPLESIWESPELADQCTFQTLYSLVERCKRATTESCIVWEQQRGYLREHLVDPFLATAHKLGWPVKIMTPSEKYHRIGVSSNKQVCTLARVVPALP